jgi:peptide deformylase
MTFETVSLFGNIAFWTIVVLCVAFIIGNALTCKEFPIGLKRRPRRMPMEINLDNTVLREVAVEIVGPVDRELVRAMFGLMHMKGGIGLAAPQVGKSIRLFVTDVPSDKPRAFVNPVMEWMSNQQEAGIEGCLSFPAKYAKVRRPVECRIRALDKKGRPFVMTARGMVARCIQHEYDHLDGVLFSDRRA